MDESMRATLREIFIDQEIASSYEEYDRLTDAEIIEMCNEYLGM